MFKKIFNITKLSIISLICGFLGAWGGASGTSKNWRRFLMPFSLSGLAYGHLKDWKCLLIMSMMGAFSIGYGIPDPTDEGSAIGRFWYQICHQNVLLANIFTRATIGFIVSLSLIWIPLIKGNWLTYLLCCSAVKTVYALISWRDLGGIWFKGKYLLMVDMIVYGTVGLTTALMIYF